MKKATKTSSKTQGINVHTRNAFETDGILKTYQSLISQVRNGHSPVIFHHTSRAAAHLYLIEVLLATVSLESHVFGMAAHFGIKFPKTMRSRGNDVKISSEKKAKIYLKEAMKRIKSLRLPTEIHSDVEGFINSHMKNVIYSIQLRNKLAHGETFHTFNSSKKKVKIKMSKFLKEFKEKDKNKIVSSIEIYKNFSGNVFYILPKKKNSKELTRVFLISLFHLMRRDDLLLKMGMTNHGNGVVISSHN